MENRIIEPNRINWDKLLYLVYENCLKLTLNKVEVRNLAPVIISLE